MIQVGSLNKGDVLLTFEPREEGEIQILVQSKLQKIFGRHMTQACLRVLEEHDVSHAKVTLQDEGALDFIIRARLKTAIRRCKRGGL